MSSWPTRSIVNPYRIALEPEGIISPSTATALSPHPTEYIRGEVQIGGDGIPRFMGYPKAIWHHAYANTDYLYAYFSVIRNGRVCYIVTRIDDEFIPAIRIIRGDAQTDLTSEFKYEYFKAVLFSLEYTTLPGFGYKDVKVTFTHLEKLLV